MKRRKEGEWGRRESLKGKLEIQTVRGIRRKEGERQGRKGGRKGGRKEGRVGEELER